MASVNLTVFIIYFTSLLVLISCDSRPNFVLLFPDEWRFDWADKYFTPTLQLNTPTFSSIVENGTRFVHTTVASPVCAPSRACIAAGKEYDYTYVPSNKYDFPQNGTTFYKLLQNNGYWVMVSGKDDLTKHSGCGINGTYRLNELGFNDQRRCKGKDDNTNTYPNVTDPFAKYLSLHYSVNHNGVNDTEWNITHWCNDHCCNDHACSQWTTVQDIAYEDNWITDNTLNMLDNIPPSLPFYLQINWAGPHPPFIITQSMNKSVNNRTYSYPMNANEDPNDMMIARRDYTGEIENLDNSFLRIINKVRELGKYDNTIFCVSSDHGEMLGDFNAFGKSKPWVASTNVPFVCMGPGIIRNNIINTYVTNMDIAGTVLDYSHTNLIQNMTTKSLRSFLNGTWNDKNNKYRSYISSGLNQFRNIVKDINDTITWKYICCQGGCPGRNFKNQTKNGLTQLLFNVKQDMYEEHNVADLYPDVVNELRPLLPPGFCVPGDYSNEIELMDE